MVVLYVVMFLLGIAVGSIVTNIAWRKRASSGVLRIDWSNPERDVFRLELKDDLDTLSTRKRIMLKVDSDINRSQK